MPRIVDHEQRRRAISAAACRVIAASGVANTTVRDIAAEAGCTTGMVVHYFAGKREVLRAALAAASSTVAERVAAGISQTTDLYALLGHFLPLDRTRTEEWRVWIAFRDSALQDEELARDHRERYRAWHEGVRLVLITAGHRAGPALDEVAEALMVVIDGIGIQAVFDPERFTPERQLALLRRQAECLLAELDPA
ncbi:TetR family transcriptional regulator [Nocardia panacis]|uniref:TetR family transcriptional regulator n=1 Tax=Nocardia panacis TaxID=2340916 RepID=A0A3A4KES2_9NOCA|nr:TetR family transcriptional regulator C-terminal domain-containing protein [Nocardia panacis]RJO74122.1 TetR family transcriptional regulator [Nocardia panacis]